MKKIKILYTIPNFDTAGSGKVVYDLVKNLDRTIFEPEICCFHNKGEFFKEIEKLGVKIHVFSFAINYRPFLTFPIRLIKTIRFLKKNRFNIIHSWHWSSDFSEPLAAKLAGIPFVYTKKAMSWGNKAWKIRSYLSTRIVTINSDMKVFFSGFNVNKIVEIPIGIDVDHWRSQPKEYMTPEGISFEHSDFVILTVANLVPIKGIEILIKAILELNDPLIKLCIVGADTSDYAIKLKKLANQNVNIYFLGKKIDLRPYHAISTIFVIPTLERGEGLPIAPIEAMASQRIVLGSDVPGIRDVLNDFEKLLFKPNNVNDLKEKLVWLKNLTDNEQKAIALQMRKKAETVYRKEDFIKKHEIVYIDLVKNLMQ